MKRFPETENPELRPAQWPASQDVLIEQAFNGGFILTTRDRSGRQFEASRPDAAFTNATQLVLFMLQQFGAETSEEVREALGLHKILVESEQAVLDSMLRAL